MAKRAFDVFAAIGGLLVLSPVFLLVAAGVHFGSPGGVFFRQQRVGRAGRPFRIYKFRTMSQMADAELGSFDAGDTSRVTPIGKVLRKFKIDELPQLINVLLGDMSLVGPRPEIQKWVDEYPHRWKSILNVQPGITDPASLAFSNEEDILAICEDPETEYRNVILPAKLELYEAYIRDRSFLGDIRIIFATILRAVRP